MDDRLSGLEVRLHEIDEALAVLCRRVGALEQVATESRESAISAIARERPAPDEAAAPVPPVPWSDLTRLFTLIGRTFVVLGGAYLLRAVTESGWLAQGGGIVLGFAYAVSWVAAADHVGSRRPASGVFHGVTGTIIGVALLWEASTRFGFLSAEGSATSLTLLVLASLGVAWHRRLEALALIVTISGTATALVLAVATGRMLPYAVSSVVIGLATTRLGGHTRWTLPRWVAALVANLLVIALISRAMRSPPLEPPVGALATALLLACGYLAAIIVPGILSRREPDVFEVLQTTGALSIGLAGGFGAAVSVGAGVPSVMGGSLLAVGTVGYLLVATRATRLSPRMCTYLSTVALALATWGGYTALSGNVRTAWLALGALALSWLSVARGRAAAAVHAVLLAIAVAFSSGLLAFTAAAWLLSPPAVVPVPALVALAVTALGLVIEGRQRDRHASAVESVARLARALVLASGVGAVAVTVVTRGLDGPHPDAVLASIRSLTLAAGAVMLAAAARAPFGRELGWLAYPLLAAAGMKLAAEDLRVSSPSMLFVVLGVYGLSVMLTAKLVGQRRNAAV